MKSSLLAIVLLTLAAVFEVAGDAVIRRGLRGGALVVLLGGCLMLAAYGVVVNLVPWDFSRLLGVYVAVFAAAAILAGRFVFGDVVPGSTWVGLGVIAIGALIIQLGPAFSA